MTNNNLKVLNPLVSVIIVNLNGKSHLDKCLKSLAAIDYPNIETILVDNNSSDLSLEFVKDNYPNIRILKLDKNYGFAKPNNMATKIAKGEYFLFLNNDTEVTPNFINELLAVSEADHRIAILQSLLLKPNNEVDSSGDFIDKLGVVYNSKKIPDKVRTISSARGASMLVRCSAFKKLDGFDEKFFVSFEDVDLSWRAWILGYKVVLVPQSIVYHIGGQTIKTIKSDVVFHGLKNQISMKITNFEFPRSWYVLFGFFLQYGLREIKIWFDYKIHGSTKIRSTKYENTMAQNLGIGVILKSLFWIMKNQKYLLTKYKKVNSGRMLKTSELGKLNVISNQFQ